MKTNKIYDLLIGAYFGAFSLTLLLMFVSSCKKDDLEILPFKNPVTTTATLQPGELYSGENFVSTIWGIVLDENNNVLEDVEVSVQGQSVMTNEKGVFIFLNASVDSKRTYITAKKDDYFMGSRAVVSIENNKTQVRIMMQSRAPGYTLPSATGGIVELSNGIELDFPADAVVDENGNLYTGDIKIAVKYLDPESSDFGFLMPGDLQGLDEDEQEVTLRSFGMLNVALTGSADQDLQVADGKEVDIKMPVPTSLVSSAPSEIPLWYFDEENGYWIEDGEAILTNGFYVGSVSHFTTWNCDWKGVTATVSGYVVDCDQNPVSGIPVSIDGALTVYTDSSGYYTSWVAADPNITITVSVDYLGLSNSVSGGPYTQGQQVSMGAMQVVCPSELEGKLVDCNGDPVEGIILFQAGNNNYTINTDSSGAFTLIVPENSYGELFGMSVDNEISSAYVVTTPAFGNTLSVGTLMACGVNLSNSFYIDGGLYNNELIVLNIFGTSSGASYYGGTDYTSVYAEDAFTSDYISLYISNCSSVGTYSSEVYMKFGSNTDSLTLYSDTSSAVMIVDVTVYDAVGGNVEGTFSGTLFGYDQNQNWTSFTITNGQFAVERLQ